jgi:hypothetical protein
MLDHEQIEAFREDDAVLSRCEERLAKGTVHHRHIMPDEQIPLIRIARFYREHARQLALEVLALHQERERLGEDAMSPGEPEAKYTA